MKSDRIKDLYSKIDTDDAMDQRIRDGLLRKGAVFNKRKTRENIYMRKDEKYNRGSDNRINFMKIFSTVLISASAFVLVAAILYGLKNVMMHFNESGRDSVSTGAPSESEDNGNQNNYSEDNSQITEGTDSEADPENETDISENLPEDSLTPEPTESILPEPSESTTPAPNESTSPNPIESATPTSTESTTPTSTESATPTPTPSSTDSGASTESANFYMAYFGVENNTSEVTAITSLVIRCHGHVKKINPADLTEVELTRDGVVVDNSVSYGGDYYWYTIQKEKVTDYYFVFVNKNVEPGKYRLTGKYKGETFQISDKTIENRVTADPADVNDLSSVSWGYMIHDNKIVSIQEISFEFKGHQNTFYLSDLTDLKIYFNGDEIPSNFYQKVYRYYLNNIDGFSTTCYNLVLIGEFKEPGSYYAKGKYRGVEFTSTVIKIQ